MLEENKISKEKRIEFTRRLDFYWQFIAAYSLAIIIYGLFRGSLMDGSFNLNLFDPVVILLFVFIIASFIGLINDKYLNKTLILGPDYIIIKNRIKEKRIEAKDIQLIRIARERAFKIRGYNRIIKIKLNNRVRWLRIRPNNYSNKKLLYESIISIKKKLNK